MKTARVMRLSIAAKFGFTVIFCKRLDPAQNRARLPTRDPSRWPGHAKPFRVRNISQKLGPSPKYGPVRSGEIIWAILSPDDHLKCVRLPKDAGQEHSSTSNLFFLFPYNFDSGARIRTEPGKAPPAHRELSNDTPLARIRAREAV
ncbi:hypothetical protein Ddc_11028 [Ditylenchus destructor]|nr:hypothetical protein Ddc_11028 [Ditylenchus destructor]